MNIWQRLFNLRGNLGSIFGGKSKNPYNGITPPTFQVDQSYTDSQKQLADLGTGILNGNLPSYYQNIGQANSPQFQALEKNITGNIQNASAQQAAASGTDRSGVAATAAASNLSSVLPNLQYSDFLNAQNQQIGLLNTGIGVAQGVRGAGQNQEGMLNNFNQNTFNEQMNLANANLGFNTMQAQQQGSALSSLAGLGVGAFTGGMGLLPGIAGGLGGSLIGGYSGGTGNLGMSTLLGSLGSFNKQTPSNSDISGFGNMVGGSVTGGTR